MSLVPVYQYHDKHSLQRFFYTTLSSLDGKSWNSPPKDDFNNWSCDGIAFYGCDASDPNAVAVYQFFASIDPGKSDSPKYFFSINPSQAGAGWTQSSQTPAFYAYAGQDAGLVEFTMWYIEQPQYSYFIGNSSQSGALAPPKGWLSVGWAVGPGQGAQPFYALPGQAKLAYTYQNIVFDKSTMPIGNPNVAYSATVTNNSSSSSSSQTVSFSKTISATVSLSLTETIGGSSSVKAEGGIPLLAEGEVTQTINYSLSSTQSLSVTQSQAITVSGTVTVPPGGSVQVTGVVYVATNTTVPYALLCLVTADVAHQTVGAASSGPCTALTDLFMQEQPNFKGSITPYPSQNGITMSLAGIMKGTWGVSADLSVEDSAAAAAQEGTGEATISDVTYTIKAAPGS